MDKPKIYLSSPHMGEEELINVQEAFATNWIAPAGPFIEQFEGDLAHYCGTKGAAVVQSGTAAIHLALRLLGIQQDDINFVNPLPLLVLQILFYTKKQFQFLLAQNIPPGTCAQLL